MKALFTSRNFCGPQTKLWEGNVFTGRNEVVAKVMFLHVCDSVHRGGSLGRETPLGQGGTPGADPPLRAGRTPLGRENPPRSRPPSPPGADPPSPLRARRTPPGADPPREADCSIWSMVARTHPTGMHSCYTCLSLILFTGGCIPACNGKGVVYPGGLLLDPGGVQSPGRQPPRADTLPGQTPELQPRRPLKRAVRILLECILVDISSEGTDYLLFGK